MRLVLYDQHIHSYYSQDGRSSILQIAQAAVRQGLSGVTITDHFDLCGAEIGFAYYLARERARREEFDRVRAQFAGRLELRWGLELGHPYQMPEQAREFLETRSFDFILGAVHFLRDGSDIYLIDYKDKATVDRMFHEYFTDLLALLEFGGFDSLAHLDYPLRVLRGWIPEATVRPYAALIDPVLRAVVQQGLSLEINTRGFMDWKGRQEPEDWVLKRYYELGGRRITIGSDAHTPGAVGAAVDRAVKKALELGFDEVQLYKGRRACPVRLQGVDSGRLQAVPVPI